MRSILLSTLGVATIAMALVALGDYHGYQGPVALEAKQNAARAPSTDPIARQSVAEAAQRSKLSWLQQTRKAKAILAVKFMVVHSCNRVLLV